VPIPLKLIDRGRLLSESLAEHIREILKTGKYSKHQKLLKKYPPGILEMLQVQGLGPKKVGFLWKKFKPILVSS